MAIWKRVIRSLGEIIYGDLSYGQSLQEMALSNIGCITNFGFILVGIFFRRLCCALDSIAGPGKGLMQ